MARTLNPEVSIMNIANQDHDIKDQYTRLLIADEEELIVASRDYDVTEFFIGNDRYLYKTLMPITAGTAFNYGVNVERGTTVGAALYDLFAQSPESISEALSNVEEGDEASKNYYKGQYIIWKDGFLYLVIKDVNIGSDWVTAGANANIELKENVTEELSKTQKSLENEIVARSRAGAHNLLLNSLKSQVALGITFTINADKSVTVSSGTASGHIYLMLSGTGRSSWDLATQYIDAGTYTVSGGNSTVKIKVRAENGGDTIEVVDSGDGVTFTTTARGRMIAWIDIDNGAAVPSVILYPMVRLASDQDISYAPGAMTNKHLTDIMDGTISFIEGNSSSYIGVSGDGVKTIKTCLNELAAAILNYTSRLDSDEYIEITGLLINSSMHSVYPNINILTKTSAAINTFGYRTVVDSSSLKNSSVTVHSTLSSCHLYSSTTTTSGTTLGTADSAVAAAGTNNFKAFFKKYRVNK